MGRQARRRSATGIHHVVLRGVNRQRIFEEEVDYEYFLGSLVRALEHSAATVFAYCLMSNHVHLLIQEGDEPLSVTMKRLTVRYVKWFNRVGDRVGHLFQNRFFSDPVEDDGHFQMVMLYIHFNPVVAGLCSLPGEYRWSSRGTLGSAGSIVDLGRLEQILSLDVLMSAEERYEPSPAEPEDLVGWSATQVSDDRAWRVISALAGVERGAAFQGLPQDEQKSVVQALSVYPISLRQISRLTGLDRRRITRWRARDD